MEAECIKVDYQKGDFHLVQGVKSGAKSQSSKDSLFINRGYGWGEEIRGSKLILTVKIGNEFHKILIDRYFKFNWGSLTRDRRDAIIKTMPYDVKLDIKDKPNGDYYFTVSEDDLFKWLSKAKLYIS